MKRDFFVRQFTTFNRAIEIAQNLNHELINFFDSADNPGGGGTGRTTQLLAKLVGKGVIDVLYGSFMYRRKHLEKLCYGLFCSWV